LEAQHVFSSLLLRGFSLLAVITPTPQVRGKARVFILKWLTCTILLLATTTLNLEAVFMPCQEELLVSLPPPIMPQDKVHMELFLLPCTRARRATAWHRLGQPTAMNRHLETRSAILSLSPTMLFMRRTFLVTSALIVQFQLGPPVIRRMLALHS
jgi:hypothetical protein